MITSSLLSLSSSANTLQHYNLSHENTIYSHLLNQHRRDIENGSTDLTKDHDPVLTILNSLFLDDHGVSKRIGSDGKLVDPLSVNMSLERLLANDKKTNILNEEELDQLQLKIEKLKAARDQLSADGVKEINEDIEHCQEKLEGHILGLAGFGYFKDFILYSEGSIRQNLESIGNKQGEEGLEKSLEDLVSSVISLSIQHGVTLPSPNLEKMKDFIGRVEWCRECIDKLVNGVSGGNSVSTVPKRNSSNKVTSTTPDNELRTALNDLQFAHVYLTRQYEDERSRYNKSLNQLRLKLSQSQELLSGSNEQLTNQTNQCLKLEMKLNEALNELREKKKELHGKNLEINLLKVDHIGGEEEEKGVERGWESPRGVSAPILRMEFKKLVGEMNEEFEKELDKERVERKRLEGLVKMYESGE